MILSWPKKCFRVILTQFWEGNIVNIIVNKLSKLKALQLVYEKTLHQFAETKGATVGLKQK